MRGHDPRSLLIRALLLDWLGQLLILFGVVFKSDALDPSISRLFQFEGQSFLLIFCFLLYPLLGWLFGSYTLLRWRRLAPCVASAFTDNRFGNSRRWQSPAGSLIQAMRYGFCIGGCNLLGLVVSRPGHSLFVSLYAAVCFSDPPRLLLLASDDEIAGILQACSGRTSSVP